MHRENALQYINIAAKGLMASGQYYYSNAVVADAKISSRQRSWNLKYFEKILYQFLSQSFQTVCKTPPSSTVESKLKVRSYHAMGLVISAPTDFLTSHDVRPPTGTMFDCWLCVGFLTCRVILLSNSSSLIHHLETKWPTRSRQISQVLWC